MRPHLQNIDNVPLLVPLFTDCTPESEYGGDCDSGSLAPSTEHCQGLGIPCTVEAVPCPMQGAKESGPRGAPPRPLGWSHERVCSRESSDWVGRSQRGAHFPSSPVPSARLILRPFDCPHSHVRDDQGHAGVWRGDLLPGQLRQPTEQLPFPPERHQVGETLPLPASDPRPGSCVGLGHILWLILPWLGG